MSVLIQSTPPNEAAEWMNERGNERRHGSGAGGGGGGGGNAESLIGFESMPKWGSEVERMRDALDSSSRLCIPSIGWLHLLKC